MCRIKPQVIAKNVCNNIQIVLNSYVFFLGWSEYGPWSPCSAVCGGGKMVRVRWCLAAEKWRCAGETEERKDCNTQRCSSK